MYLLRNTLLSTLILLITLSLFSSLAFAQGVSIEEKTIKVEVINVQTEGGKVKGSVRITNPNPLIYPDSLFTIKLSSKDIIGKEQRAGKQTTLFSPGSLIDYQNSPKFTLNANNTQEVPFSLTYGASLSTDSYKLQISLYTTNSKLIGSYNDSIPLSGNGTFLQIKDCVLNTSNTNYDPTIGANVAINGVASGKCVVVNSSNSSITATPESYYGINTLVGYENSSEVDFVTDQPVTIAPKSSRNVTIPLPSLEKAQVYEAFAYFKDSNGSIMSPKVAFRWVVSGESAAIRSVTWDSESYKKGETAKVVVGADPSMDLFWNGGGPTRNFSGTASVPPFVQPELSGTPLNDPIILVSIKDGSGNFCGSSEKKIEVNSSQNIWPDQAIDVPMEKDCVNPVVTATVKNGSVELATKEVRNPILVQSDTQSANGLNALKWWQIVGGILIAILIGAAAYFIYKRRKKVSDVTTTVSLFILLWAAFSGNAPLIDFKSFTLNSVVTTVEATEVGPGAPVSVHYEGIKASRDQVCPGPDWKGQPQISGENSCTLDMVSGWDETNFTFLNTQEEITFSNNQINAHIAGQFKGFGCGNTDVGLIVRAFVNGTDQGVQINGGSSRAVFENLAKFGGGAGTNVDFNIAITSTSSLFCGPQAVKLELIPFIKHIGMAASDMAEDQLLDESDVPGWQNVTYTNRKNCNAPGESCWGVLQKTVEGRVGGDCPGACNMTCVTPADCASAQDGCTSCVPNDAGTGSVCAQPPACGIGCVRDDQCAGAVKDGCTVCAPSATGSGSVCSKPPACGAGCERDDQCAGAVKDGCTSCLPSTTGTGSVCSKPPACGSSCVRDDQCGGAAAKDGCTVCEVDTPGGVGSCQKPFDEAACKCDGFNAINISNPSQGNFKFEAFGKVEGKDMSKAKIDSMTFSLYKSSKSNPNASTKIATSDAITPTIVSSDSAKIRYRAEWSVAPPVFDPNAIYRVGADTKCTKVKGPVVSEAFDFNGNTALYNSDNSTVLGENLNYTPAKLVQSNDNLELGTLEDGYFTRIVDTDSCRFLRFEYGQY